jgi:hypothetical protein
MYILSVCIYFDSGFLYMSLIMLHQTVQHTRRMQCWQPSDILTTCVSSLQQVVSGNVTFGTHFTSHSAGYVFCWLRSASWQRERVCADFHPFSFNISIPLQPCTGPGGFHELEVPGTSRQLAGGDKVVSPTHRPPLSPQDIPGAHSY